jgi:lambda family phage portal protein
MNWLDRTIGYVAPATALRRARHRAAMTALARSYEGARVGRRTEGWVVAGTSVNAEIGTALSRLRDRSRDLVRNNAYAAKAVQAVVSNLVGTGILPRARSGDPAINEMADKLWARFAESCDADGLTDFSGLQALIVRAMAESGECPVRIRERRIEDGLAVPLQLQVLEPDHLDTAKTGDLANGGFVVQGVEFDPLGRRRAYWMFPVHPGEVAMFRRVSLTRSRCRRHPCCTCSTACGRGRCAAYRGSRR